MVIEKVIKTFVLSASRKKAHLGDSGDNILILRHYSMDNRNTVFKIVIV